ncbi:ferritin-like domain-containing protein [Tessaracoccus caeni]|uniref:ferritin-like domain-containing protein n=1 Tax=Tessaracoccus caeni TaxID=3031239 RepID=UPI0023D987D6|nr:ferritin-like domain-containing protein [Tessaracoccus caeni]MDF1488564.1 ferritin-like domain-containing protein [Tessaracoccus caeni]
MAFDLENFAATSDRVRWEDLDFDHFDEHPLDDDTLRALRYMCDVEYHTSCYLRDLLVTRSHRKDEARGFMTTWNREEFWHGEALAAVLGRHGITVGYDELKARRVKLGWREAMGPSMQSALSNLVGDDFIAVHMTWGAANELSAVAAYRRLAGMMDHPALSPLLKRIAQQETRHVAFYTTQARAALERSEKAPGLVSTLMSKAWRPVGSSIMSEDEVRYVMGYLFTGQGAAVDKLDQSVSRLPGLDDLTIFRTAFTKMGIDLQQRAA